MQNTMDMAVQVAPVAAVVEVLVIIPTGLMKQALPAQADMVDAAEMAAMDVF